MLVPMRAIARALIFTTQFLELSDDTVVDSGAAVRAMESIADELSRSTPEEREALRSALQELIDRGQSTEPNLDQRARLQFYAEFMESFGLEAPGGEA
jgi:hypothetical protein